MIRTKGGTGEPGEDGKSKFPSDIRRHIFTQCLVDTWRGHLPGTEKHSGHCECKQMPKPGKTTLIFTKYHLFFCLQKHFFNTNWTYLAFPPNPVDLHPPLPDAPNQIQFKMQAMLEVTGKWPRWPLMPAHPEAEGEEESIQKGNNASVFQFNISQYINDVIWNPSAEMKHVNVLSRSQWSILSPDFTSTHSLCCKERGTF